MRTVIFAVLCVLAASYLGATEVYKTVDAQGHVIYSDRPDPAAQKLQIHTNPRDVANATRLAHDQKIEQAQQADRDRVKAAADKDKAQEEQERQSRCQRARQRYFAIKDVRRLYRLDDSGNRTYYSDTDADAQRAEAQQAMQAECGT